MRPKPLNHGGRSVPLNPARPVFKPATVNCQAMNCLVNFYTCILVFDVPITTPGLMILPGMAYSSPEAQIKQYLHNSSIINIYLAIKDVIFPSIVLIEIYL